MLELLLKSNLSRLYSKYITYSNRRNVFKNTYTSHHKEYPLFTLCLSQQFEEKNILNISSKLFSTSRN